MKKATTILGVISIMLSVFLLMIFLQFLNQSSSGDGGWASLGYFLISLVFMIVAIIMSIPYITYVVKLKFKNMLFYHISHLSFLLLSAASLIYSLNG